MNESGFNFNKILRFFLPSFFGLALIAVPLGVSYFFPIASPFVLIKITWLQVLAALTVLIFLLFIIFEKKYKNYYHLSSFLKTIFPVWLFWLAIALLSLWSLNPWQSWFGSYIRQTGVIFYFWLAIWHSFLIYYFGGFYKSENKIDFWGKGVKISALLMSLSGFLISIYAFFQFCGYDFAVWQEPQLLSRAIGTLGQPNFLGSFLLLTLSMTAYIFFSSSNFYRKFLFVFIFIFQFIGLLISGSRSAWLSAIIVLVFLCFIQIWRRWRWRSFIFIPVLFFLISSLFYFLTPARFTSLFDFNSGSIALRRSFYSVSWGLIEERPLLGFGLENGGEAFFKAYQTDWGALMNVDAYTDRAHNIILDVLIQLGFVGLLIFFIFYIFLARQCYLLFCKKNSRLFALSSIAALSAYGLSLLFGIPDISSLFYFSVIASLVMAGNIAAGDYAQSSIASFWQSLIKLDFFKRRKYITSLAIKVLGIFLFLLSIAQIYFNFSSLQADYYWLQIRRLLSTDQYVTMSVIWSYLDEKAINPVASYYYKASFVSYLLSDFNNLPDLASKNIVSQELNVIFLDLSDKSYDGKIVKARLTCFFLGAETSAPLFKQLIFSSPLRPAVYRDYAQCLQASGLEQEALDLYFQALFLLPSRDNHLLNYEHLAYLNFYSSRIYKEIALLQGSLSEFNSAADAWKSSTFLYPDDMDTHRNRIDNYINQGNYTMALNLAGHGLARQPHSYLWPLLLSRIYTLKNDLERADYWQTRALFLNPALSDIYKN